MKNAHRRKRRKDSSRTRSGSSTRVMQALVAVVAIMVCGTLAYGDPICFDNPAHGEAGHFHWAVPEGDNTNWLDFTQAASAQPGTPWGDSSLRHAFNSDTPWGVIGTDGAGTVQVEKDSFWIAALGVGDMIPSGAPTTNEGYVYYEGYETPHPEGTPSYMGIHFDIGDGVQYAWIGFVRTAEQVEAFAWAYETEPGVPITVPEPGTLAGLALGAAALLRRRRCRSQID